MENYVSSTIHNKICKFVAFATIGNLQGCETWNTVVYLDSAEATKHKIQMILLVNVWPQIIFIALGHLGFNYFTLN